MRKFINRIIRFYHKDTLFRIVLTISVLYVLVETYSAEIITAMIWGLLFILLAAFTYPLYRLWRRKQRRNAISINQALANIDSMTGVEFELFLRKIFELQGYHVTMTKTSGDYGADLILSNGKDRVAVQAKRYSGSVGVEAVQQALAARDYYKCNHAMVVTNSRFTPNAKELAKNTGVEMWARERLGREIYEVEIVSKELLELN